MDLQTRIEQCLEAALAPGTGTDAPPRLAEAMRYAVFPGGKRIRPRVCLAVAASCGDSAPGLSGAAATALELLHCASLVHDDLPCFDDAALRRGKPSVHRAYGEATALLVGDALIVLAFDVLAAHVDEAPARAASVLRIVAGAVGTPHGIVAGQAWEAEPEIELATYHRAKTGALFAAASAAGAAAAGADPVAWRIFGDRLGEAYQIADDISDLAGDAACGQPNMVAQIGLAGARTRLRCTLDEALDSIPACPGRDKLAALMKVEAEGLMRAKVSQSAA